MKWEPIETAPKDGTPILLWCLYENKYGEVLGPYFWVGPPQDDYDVSPGWYPTQDDGDFDGLASDETPTHWMPLPEPPESDK